MEMEQIAEGYYGTNCIYQINQKYKVDTPILNGMYDVLYRNVRAEDAIREMAKTFV